MPSWLTKLLIDLVLKFGVPYVLDWISKHAPWLTGVISWIHDKFPWPVFSQYVENRKVNGWEKQYARNLARAQLHECYGISCRPEPVRDR